MFKVGRVNLYLESYNIRHSTEKQTQLAYQYKRCKHKTCMYIKVMKISNAIITRIIGVQN